MQPLEGVRVVEIGGGVAGPFAAKLLADFGADVVKVEPPAGDPTRHEPPFVGGVADAERSAAFLHLNTNKRSVVVDLGDEAGVALVGRLIQGADIVVESLAAGRLGGLGLGHQALVERNRRLVTVSVTPFGQDGPYASFASSELVAYAMGGTLNSTGEADREPVKMAGSIGLYQCGNVAALAALGALMVAEESDRGVHVDVSNLETQAGSIDRRLCYLLYRAYTGRDAPRQGGGAQRHLPNGFYPFEDGYGLLATMPAWLPRMLATVRDPELVERYRDPGYLVDDELPAIADAAMFAWTLPRTRQGAMEEAQANGWPVVAVKTPREVVDDPHWTARGFFVDVDHPLCGPVRQPGPPIRMEDGWRIRRPAPLLDEHREEILAELDAGGRRGRAGVEVPAGVGGAAGVAATPRRLPLEGVRVVDMTVVWSGPYATTLLSDLGAEVIRVENPWVFPSVTRGLLPRPPRELVPGLGPIFGPYPDLDPGPRPWNRIGLFAAHGRNKAGATLDLRKPSGREAFLRLIEHADVFVENNSVDLVDKLGIGWDAVHERNPRLVMVRMPSVGLDGPYRHFLGFGLHFETLTGFSATRGYADRDPTSLGAVFHMDAASGPAAAFATIAALRRRARTGRGELIELAQAENMMQHLGEYYIDAAANGTEHGPIGNRHPSRAPQGVYPSLAALEPAEPVVGNCGTDRWVAISVGDDAQWAGLRRAMGDPAWAADARFASAAGRREHHDELDGLISAWTAPRSAGEVAEACQREGVAAGPVYTEADCYADAQLNARGFFRDNGNDELGAHRYGGHVWRWDGPDLAWGPICKLGADNRRVWQDIVGMSDAEYAALDAEGHLSLDYLDADGAPY